MCLQKAIASCSLLLCTCRHDLLCAKDVIKGRFEKGENVINNNSQYKEKYKQLNIKHYETN